MVDYISRLLDTHMLSPHGICLLWRPELLWTHVISDALIFCAYMTIPAALGVVVYRRRDIPFGWMMWSFALFITACGFTHLMSIWTLWNPDYGVEGMVKAVTALASIATAVALWRLVPAALAVPSPAQLREVNEALRQRIAERDRAIAELERERAERLKVEEALLQSQKMDALGQITGGIAHDFNNVLQAISGTLQLIARHPREPERIEALADRGLRATDRGARVAGQLLAFARTRQLRSESVPLDLFLAEVRDLLAQAAGPTVDLRFEIAEPDLAVSSDRTQLELALLNLAINARDAMPEGGRVVIGLRRVDVGPGDPALDPGAYAELTVGDSGSGMSPDARAHAFEPFFTTKAVGKGAGLGLAQVYGVARQSGGVARILSTGPQGTCIALFLPLSLEESRAPRAPARVAPAAPLTGRVLVVDDDPDVRAFAASAVETLGGTPVVAADGPSAISRAAAGGVDLVLMDYAMPGMTGAEAAREIARLRPDLPIVFMTGYGDPVAIERALGQDAPILRKPFQLQDLAVVLDRALRLAA